jgi:hypothetical protein
LLVTAPQILTCLIPRGPAGKKLFQVLVETLSEPSIYDRVSCNFRVLPLSDNWSLCRRLTEGEAASRRHTLAALLFVQKQKQLTNASERHGNVAFRLPNCPVSLQLVDENNDGEKSGGLDLLDQVSKNSVGEVDGLIGELRRLRAKLQADGDRIKRDIEQYETLSQQVMQLTKIISDSVATISNVRRLVDGRTH